MTYMRKILIGSLLVFIVLVIAAVCIAPKIMHQQKYNTVVGKRDALITQAIHNHPVKFIVSDGARMTALKAHAGTSIRYVSVQDCTVDDTTTKGTAAVKDLADAPFAYVLQYDVLGNGRGDCTLDQVVHAFGRPSASAVIAGTVKAPLENILFYDHGTDKTKPRVPLTTALPKQAASVVPISLSQLPVAVAACTSTTLNIVAHQDDDLLFMNPDVLHDVGAGNCVRSVYLTAGDAGQSDYYWLGREQGSEVAYSTMTTEDDTLWTQRIVELNHDQFVNISTPRDEKRISLLYFRLPDGNLRGQGFKDTKYESLAKLRTGKIVALHSVDNESTFSSAQLQAALLTLMNYYKPNIVRTQSTISNPGGTTYTDHSDHTSSGYYAQQAFAQYKINNPNSTLISYYGYPVHGMPANVGSDDLALKETVFLQYAKSDHGVCQSVSDCAHTATYQSYLTRQYQAKN